MLPEHYRFSLPTCFLFCFSMFFKKLVLVKDEMHVILWIYPTQIVTYKVCK